MAGWVGRWTEQKGGLFLTAEHQLTDVEGVVEKLPFYNHHSKELFSKNHLFMINVRGEFDEEQVSKSLPQIAYELKRKTY